MSVNRLTKQLASNDPPILDPDLFAQQCAKALKAHRRSDIIYGAIIGLLLVPALLAGTQAAVNCSRARNALRFCFGR